MARRLGIPGDIVRLRYFTARTKQSPDDLDRPVRQQTLIRAMETLPEVSVHWGQHINIRKKGILVGDSTKTISTFDTREEKGSDVSLGVYMVRDAALGEIDVVIMISNDSDLADVVTIVQDDFGRPVYVASPQPLRHPSTKLRKRSTGLIVIDSTVISKCQFPGWFLDARGRKITCPSAWSTQV